MALTQQEAEAQWRAENPFPQTVAIVQEQQTGETEEGEPIYELVATTRETTQAEYDAMATDRATLLVNVSVQDDAEAADAAEGRSIMEKIAALETTADRLDSSEVLTQTQQRHFNAEHMRVTAQVMRYLNKHSAKPIEEETMP